MAAPLFEEQKFFFSTRLRHLFKYGGLPGKWHHQYPHLFSEQDVNLTRRGSSYLFFEWLASITFFHLKGYVSHHKFECENHTQGFAVFSRLVGSDFARTYLKNCKGSPDLLVVSPDSSDWFFCEVKGPRDRIGPAQRRIARLIYQHTKRKVVLLTFDPVD